MDTHRKRWACDLCGDLQHSAKGMSDHLRTSHLDKIDAENIDNIALRYGRPAKYIPASDCPLCDYPAVLRRRGYTIEEYSRLTTDKFARHLGRHLEQLSLFVLPKADIHYEEDDDLDSGLDDREYSEWDDDLDESAMQIVSEPDLVAKLAEQASLQVSPPEILADPPDLAMRWQPPHDFTPPEEDFDTEDVDLLPVRQEPIYGGDLHTPGWARRTGKRKEGFCARCPISHWVNMADGSYGFHLTYFHGVPDSGVPLPRPSTIRPVKDNTNVWEGFCETCNRWKILKKTKRGWNWYRHWLEVRKAHQANYLLPLTKVERCRNIQT